MPAEYFPSFCITSFSSGINSRSTKRCTVCWIIFCSSVREKSKATSFGSMDETVITYIVALRDGHTFCFDLRVLFTWTRRDQVTGRFNSDYNSNHEYAY